MTAETAELISCQNAVWAFMNFLCKSLDYFPILCYNLETVKRYVNILSGRMYLFFVRALRNYGLG